MRERSSQLLDRPTRRSDAEFTGKNGMQTRERPSIEGGDFATLEGGCILVLTIARAVCYAWRT